MEPTDRSAPPTIVAPGIQSRIRERIVTVIPRFVRVPQRALVGLATGGYEGGYTRWGGEPGNCGRTGDPHTWQNTKSGPTRAPHAGHRRTAYPHTAARSPTEGKRVPRPSGR